MIFLLVLCVAAAAALPDEPGKTYDKLFHWGVGSYNDERWYECVAFLQRAIEDFKWAHGIGTHCRHKCKNRAVWEAEKPPQNELAYADRVLRKSLCLQRCILEYTGSRPVVEGDRALEAKFRAGHLYSYIQMCYWKLDDLEHAVGAAFTFLTLNPGDEMMIENLDFYSAQPGFQKDWLIDIDEYSYQSLYVAGTDAYAAEEWAEVAERLSQAVSAYLEHYGDREVWCDDVFPAHREGPRELYVHLADAYSARLGCLVNVTRDMDRVRGAGIPNLLASYFHYLQYAYWKVEQVRAACEAVGTYLLFFPEDETMLRNKAFYTNKFQLQERSFAPEKRVVLWLNRRQKEMQLFSFVQEKFKIEDGAMTSEHPDDWKLLEDYEDLAEKRDEEPKINDEL